MNKFLLGLLLFASQCTAQTPYVKDWLILGTFPNPDAATRLSQDYLQGESAASPRGGETTLGHQWLMYHSSANYLNLLSSDLAFSPSENCVAYAVIFVHSPFEQNVHLLVGSDDAIAVWCNGTRIHFLDAHRGIQLDNDTVAAALRKGWNTILFKVANADGGYALAARFGDGNQLTVTPLNPFPLSQELTPANVSLDTSAIAFRFEYSPDNQPRLYVNVRVRNAGMSNAKRVSVRTSPAEAPLEIPVVYGGEIKDTAFSLPFAGAMLAGTRAIQGTVELEYGGDRFNHFFSAAEKTLRALFLPWVAEGEKGNPREVLYSRTIVIPADLAGLGFRFKADIGGDWGEVLVNSRPLLVRFSGDSGDLLLTSKASPNDTFRVEVRAIEPSSSTGQNPVAAALVPFNEPMQLYLDNVRFSKEIYGIDPGDQSETFRALFGLLHKGQADQAGSQLKAPLEKISSLVPDEKRLTLHLVGNAHIDIAWLWRFTETMDVTHSTLQAAVDNLQTNSNFKFSHGQAQSYQWIEERYPELFRRIQAYVREGRWEIVGGTWVESDANIPSGESLIRQFLYGKRYFKTKFGVDVKHGWYPDTFGHPASLPEILSGCGIESYTFYRPDQPERMFTWRGTDGSSVLAHHPSNWYGTWAPLSDTLWKSAERSWQALGLKDALQFYGVGDHGGGPTRRDIATIEHLSKLSMYPKVRFSTLSEYYRQVAADQPELPVGRGEQNPVFEGCYTSQAMVKANNRRAEALLPTAEAFSVIASQYGYPYPSASFEEAWHKVLFNQFHDILCGSGIHAVYDDALRFYEEAFQRAGIALEGSLRQIAEHVNTRQPDRSLKPVLLFNPLNWKRADLVTLTFPVAGAKTQPRVYGSRGKQLEVQVIQLTRDSVQFVFVPDSIPPMGYRTVWVRMDLPAPTATGGALRQPDELKLENHWFWIELDQATGAVSRIYDKVHKRELLPQKALANQLTIQEDDAGMSAWVIGLKGTPQPINVPSSIQVLKDGPVRKTIRVEYHLEESTFTQDISLCALAPRIDFRLSVDWRHRKRILKVAFPLNLAGIRAAFEIPYGAIERPSDGKETVAQKWVDISTSDFGVSLLNDSKYGFDVSGSVIHMTVLRSPTDPDPKADEGYHACSYALYPHEGGWREGLTVRQAYEFNTPLAVSSVGQHSGPLPSSLSFFTLDSPSFVVTTLKKSEDDGSIILRGYESAGRMGDAHLKSWLPFKEIHETDQMEWSDKSAVGVQPGKRTARLSFGPNQVKSWKITLDR